MSVDKREAEEGVEREDIKRVKSEEVEEVKEEIKEKEEEIKTNYTYGEWNSVLTTAVIEGNENKITKLFDTYLSQYVNDGDKWTMYIEWMMNKEVDGDKLDKKRIESSFFKILTKIYNVELWRLYLKYVEKVNPITAGNAENARNIVLKAYQFSIEIVGQDFFESYNIWSDYLRYLYIWQPVTPNEEKTKMELIRSSLKRMISYPSIKLEDNWKIFVKFEEDLDLNQSRKIINENIKEYLKLKEINDELMEITKSISKLKDRKYSIRQIRRWNKWIEWEKKNLMNKNEVELKKRINYVYNLSIQYCNIIPEIWYNYYEYLKNEEDIDKSNEILNDGLKVNPISLILTNEVSNEYEIKGDIEKIKEIWIKLIKNIEEDEDSFQNKNEIITYCYCRLMKIINRIGDIKEVRIIFKMSRNFKGIEWNIFKEYSMIEYYKNELGISKRAYSIGMQYFNNNIRFICSYLDFLVLIKDMTNFKKIMEMSLEKFEDSNDRKKLFKKYFKVEDRFGDIGSIKMLIKRSGRGIYLLEEGLRDEEDDYNEMKSPVAVLDQYRKGGYNVELEEVFEDVKEVVNDVDEGNDGIMVANDDEYVI
ncbi:cleavage polyadenylation factor subunit [Pichia kluyveri]|uniref:mRNA 3'-end-processing protein RNA14 n=1 Tax=Pichia kluyveri TaxID=36015 RepID=A0AAV5R2Q5_PICKL|nr:cleavage polyadenylation factor subunit [Pichia kluyveri]